MIEHYILLALVLAMAILSMEAKTCRPLLVILAAIFIGIAFVMASWRADTVGGDTIQYAQFFTLSSWFQEYDSLQASTRFEAGYTALNYLVTRVTDNFGFLLCLINAFMS